MPYSLVLNLLPQSPIPPQFLTGRHLHALFLTLVSSVDRNLGNYLHDSSADKAFTLSPLQISRQPKSIGSRDNTLQWERKTVIPAGTPCWWRISLLDDTLFTQLNNLWLNLNPKHPWHLGPADLYITSILGTPQSTQPWANTVPYAALYEQASDSNRMIALSFATPTAFRQGQYDTVLPTRESVFNSLLNRWNKYSDLKIDNIPVDSMFSSFVNLRTEILADSRSKFIGVVGEVSYRLLGDLEPSAIKNVNTLAEFSLYSGIGRKTTMGMGMTRRLPFSLD